MALTNGDSATNSPYQNERSKIGTPAPFPHTYQVPDIHDFYQDWGIQRARMGGFTDTSFSGRDKSLAVMLNSKDIRSGNAMVHMFRRGKVGAASVAPCVYSGAISDHPGAFAAYTKDFEVMRTRWAKEIVGYTGKYTPLEKWKWLPKTVSSARMCFVI